MLDGDRLEVCMVWMLNLLVFENVMGRGVFGFRCE